MLYIVLIRAGVSGDEMEDYIMKGACGSYSIGILANCSLREDAPECLALDSLNEAVQCAEAVVFSACDSEAFAIWCPKV